jgi:hypothetical protein
MADALAYRRVPPDDDPWAARREELKARAEKEAAGKPKSGRQKAEDPEVDEAPTILATSPGQVPDLRGQTTREAVGALVARGYRARVEGSGVVVRQSPAPGTPLAPGEACTLRLGDAEQILEDERRARASAAVAAAPIVASARPLAAPPRSLRKRR